jgi:hypothetical protein
MHVLHIYTHTYAHTHDQTGICTWLEEGLHTLAAFRTISDRNGGCGECMHACMLIVASHVCT